MSVTITADGIAISYPVRWEALLGAVRYSNGTTVAVTEEEIVAAHGTLAARGIFVELTSAVVAAALQRVAEKLIKPRETVVGILTGHGLKNPPRI